MGGVIRGVDKIPQQRYSRLLGLFCAEVRRRCLLVKSIVLFGSAARGKARNDSDIDLLVVAEGVSSLGEALDRPAYIETQERFERRYAG